MLVKRVDNEVITFVGSRTACCMRCTSAKPVQIAPRMNSISETQTFYLGGWRLNKTLASLKFRVKTPRNLLLLREHERQLSNTNALVAAMLDFEKLKRTW